MSLVLDWFKEAQEASPPGSAGSRSRSMQEETEGMARQAVDRFKQHVWSTGSPVAVPKPKRVPMAREAVK